MNSAIEAMTVNEGLFHFGLVVAFDRAARERDIGEMFVVLTRAQLSDVQARQAAEDMAKEPARYGF